MIYISLLVQGYQSQKWFSKMKQKTEEIANQKRFAAIV